MAKGKAFRSGKQNNRYVGNKEFNPDHYKPAKSKNVVTTSTVVWFGKYKGLKATDVPKSYWKWAAVNLDRLAINPELWK